MYKAKVKYNGNHYFAGQEIKGSKIRTNEDGTVELFDDEPIEEFPFYGEGREEWVEVDKNTLIDIKYYIAEKQTGICLFKPHSFNRLYFDTIEDAKQHLIELDENVNDYYIKEQ